MNEGLMSAQMSLRAAALKYARLSDAASDLHCMERDKLRAGNELEEAALRYAYVKRIAEGTSGPG